MSELKMIDKTWLWLDNSKNFIAAGVGAMTLGIIGMVSAYNLTYTKADDGAIEAKRALQAANIATLTEDEAKFFGILDDREDEEYPIDGIISDIGEQGVERVDMNQVIRVWNANESFEDSIAEETDFGLREGTLVFSSGLVTVLGAAAAIGGVIEINDQRRSNRK